MVRALCGVLVFAWPALAAAQEPAGCAPAAEDANRSCKQANVACTSACEAAAAKRVGYDCASDSCGECNQCEARCKNPRSDCSPTECVDSCSACNGCEDIAKDCARSCEWKLKSCNQKVAPEELKGTAFSLRLRRNEIFARYGYLFKSQPLLLHFRKMDWYEGRCSQVDGLLSKNERARVDALKKAEQAAARAELAALPPELREFWLELRAATAAADAERLAALAAFPFARGKTQTLTKEQFAGLLTDLLPPNAAEAIKLDVPSGAGDTWSLLTLPLYEGAAAGRSYEFRKTGKSYRWTGIVD